MTRNSQKPAKSQDSGQKSQDSGQKGQKSRKSQDPDPDRDGVELTGYAPWDYYRQRSRIGGVEIIDTDERTNSRETTTYLISYLCCDKRAVLSHRHIEFRAKKESVGCSDCCKSRLVYFKPGDDVDGMTILGREKRTIGKLKKLTEYSVRNRCCSTIATITHMDIVERMDKQRGKCVSCFVAGGGSVDVDVDRGGDETKRRVVFLQDYGVKFHPDWRPLSFSARGKHVLWCDRMGRSMR